MTRFDVAVLSFRILAIYFLFEVLRGLAQLAVIMTGTLAKEFPAPQMSIPLALLGILALFLFVAAPAIARGLFRGDEPMSTANRPEIGALALRICGVLFLANALGRLGDFLDRGSSSTAVQIAVIGALAAIGLALFFFASAISRRLFGPRTNPLPVPQFAHVQAVTFSVLGIWLLVMSLSALAESMRERIQLDAWARGVWPQIALAVFGLLLFLGGGGLSAFWHWMRHAGLSARPERPR